MKAKLFTPLVVALMAAVVAGCSPESSASLSFALTDAPVDDPTIVSVMVGVTSLDINSSGSARGDSGWKSITLTAPAQIDLLSLHDGLSQALGDISLAGGMTIQQIRLNVSGVTVGKTDGSSIAAVLPSGALKVNAHSFDVPASGTFGITLDFDVRKSLVARSGGYNLKPVIRAVFDHEAGTIAGALTGAGFDATKTYVVYAYASPSGLASDPAATVSGTDRPVYGGAYSSAKAVDGAYRLSYMDAGTYELWVADASDAVGTPLLIVPGVSVASGSTATEPIALP
jgi:hypothetical protein